MPWDPSPHTLIKHKLYRRYLQAWLPILVQGGYGRLDVVDGFAGPGRYLGGEPGSPLVAVKAILDHSRLEFLYKGSPLVSFLFIEERSDRYHELTKVLAPYAPNPEIELVKKINV